MTLDTSSKMYSDKQAQDTVGPPHRWQILQGPDTENSLCGLTSVWLQPETRWGGYLAEEAPNVAISQRYNFAFPSQIRQIIKS